MRALFFLRHYNDVDHITPVISKWVDSGHSCDIVLIGFEYFRNDFRIEFLKKLPGVRLTHIQELLTLPDFIRWRMQMLLLIRGLRLPLLGPVVNAVAQIYNAKRREPIWRRITQHLLTRTFEGTDGGVVAFDWVERNSTISVEWVEIVVSMAHEAGLSIVSLPHGDSPHASQLIRRNELKLGPDTLFSAGRMFDSLVVPNELCAGRFRPFMDNERVAVLGSPRYCDEWLTKLATLLPPTPLTRSDSKLKVLMFLRKSNFTTFWEEVGYVVQLIASFPGVELMIKPHTRGGWQQTLTRDSSLRKLSNVSVAGGGVHSAHLLEWADVIVDLATSVSFEAVKVGKPVLAADYLIAGRSIIAQYMPETELRCRDDVYEKIDSFLRNGCDSFYIEEHRQRFIDEMLHVGGPDVLPRFVALLESQVQTKLKAVPTQQKESVLPVAVSIEETEQVTVLKEVQSNDQVPLPEELRSKLSDETTEPGMPSIDVVIPVYNAPDLTRRCIDSIIANLGRSVRYIYVQDDASGAETREMLDQLSYERVRVHHSAKNQGFGLSVNEAIARSDATYVLVLNSDTESSEDFLPILCAAMEADPKLAVIIPSGNYYAKYDFDRYPRQPGGYILTHRLRGYAFLIRRDVFQKIGGFDPTFGRGYYEDIDLGRRLDLLGWRIGVHPSARIYHKGGGSFGRSLSYLKLVRHNRNLYFSRYPNAERNILLFSDDLQMDHLPANLLSEIEVIFREGGCVHWLTRKPASQIWCMHMPNLPLSMRTIIRLSIHGWLRQDKRVSEIWMLPDISTLLRSSLLLWGRVNGLKVRSWDDTTTKLKLNQKVLGEIGADGCVKNAISVIIPCYNYGAYLGEAIESVIAQTRKPIEIIVMDDASTDNTSEVVKSFPVRYVRNPLNLGASENFNLGIHLARGEYILHLDADDRLHPEFLTKTASILDTHPTVAIAYTHLTLFGPFAKDIYDSMPERKMGFDNGSYRWRVREFDRQHLLKRGNYIFSASLFRKSAFEEAGGYPDLPHREDYEFWRNIIKLGWEAKLVPEYLVDYRQHSLSQRNIAGKSSFRKYTRIIFKNLIYRLGFNRY